MTTTIILLAWKVFPWKRWKILMLLPQVWKVENVFLCCNKLKWFYLLLFYTLVKVKSVLLDLSLICNWTKRGADLFILCAHQMKAQSLLAVSQKGLTSHFAQFFSTLGFVWCHGGLTALYGHQNQNTLLITEEMMWSQLLPHSKNNN